MRLLLLPVLVALASCASPAVDDSPEQDPAPVAAEHFAGIVLTPPAEGWSVPELVVAIHEQAGIPILHDPDADPPGDERIEFIGDARIPEDRVIEWLQAVLTYHRWMLVPIGVPREHGARAFYLMRCPERPPHSCLLY